MSQEQVYRQVHPEGYRYSWFCERYQHWRRHLDVVGRYRSGKDTTDQYQRIEVWFLRRHGYLRPGASFTLR